MSNVHKTPETPLARAHQFLTSKATFAASFLFLVLACSAALRTYGNANSTQADDAQALIAQAVADSGKAYGAILRAEQNGANVTQLISTFNAALDSLQTAEEQARQGNFSEAITNAAVAKSAFDTVSTQADSLNQIALSNQVNRVRVILLLGLVTVGLVSVLFLVGLLAIRRLQWRRLMRSEISRVQKDAEDQAS